MKYEEIIIEPNPLDSSMKDGESLEEEKVDMISEKKVNISGEKVEEKEKGAGITRKGS